MIEFEDQRASSRDVVPNDILVGHLSEMLNDGSQGVSVSHYYHSLTIKNLRADLIIPVRKNTIDGDLEGLCGWENI